jgi:hypothetical protein
LFLERNGLPSPLLNQIKRLAAFQNLEFYKRQGMRLSAALTPRVITCAEDLSEHIVLPRGCWPEIEALLNEYGVALSVADKREDGATLGCYTYPANPCMNVIVEKFYFFDFRPDTKMRTMPRIRRTPQAIRNASPWCGCPPM